MKIKDVLLRDPATNPLVNNGQARVAPRRDELALRELRGELAVFVCEGQYADGIERIVSSFLSGLSRTNQPAAWVSGFFGSGKTHFLKMLAHLWANTTFPDGAAARDIVPLMPDELRALLRELDIAGKRAGGLVAADGTFPAGAGDQVRLIVLDVILRAVGLPGKYPQAQFSLWLHENGFHEAIKKHVEDAGRNWETELNNLYVSKFIANALLASDPAFAANELQARQTVQNQFPLPKGDISTDDFLRVAKQALRLERGNRMPCTVLVLDEVQQYTGNSNERSVLITEIAEALSKQMDSHVILVAAGQSALTEVPLLQKLMGRFTLRVTLADSDVERVTRQMLLQKKPTAKSDVEKLLNTHAGEISRQLQGTRIATSHEDASILVDDYPLLPVRRRFWEHCFRQIDAAGTQSQLRSQLRIIHDAVAKIADQPLGTLVAGDDLFEALAPEMVNTGVLLRETNERIASLGKDGTPEGRLAQRICGLVFLITRLKRDGGADIGVRATKEHIADLLVEDLTVDNSKLRSQVEVLLKQLMDRGDLALVGNEYRLQTKEGAEWDREFRTRQAKIGNDESRVQIDRQALLSAEVRKSFDSVKLRQGAAKVDRKWNIGVGQNPPSEDGLSIPTWIQDQWSSSLKEVQDRARSAGSESPLVCVFVEKQTDDLRTAIVDAEAAQETLAARAMSEFPEGQEARKGMESRRDLATAERDRLTRSVVAAARIFQGGGTELLQPTLDERIREAGGDSLARLFPRFKEGDSGAWPAVIKRARDGADQPFQPAGHDDTTEKHPVCKQVLSLTASGMTGTDIRKKLVASPFGWPQDAIDAGLIALHRSQHLSARLNGTPVQIGQLDQARIARTEFRAEQITLGIKDRLAVRQVFQALNITAKNGDEASKAAEFLKALSQLADDTAGEAPMPVRASTAYIEDIQKLTGNAQLVAIKEQAPSLLKTIDDWKKQRELAQKRVPVWETVERMVKHASGIASARSFIDQAEAVRKNRMLLDATDPISSLRTGLADALRKELTTVNSLHGTAYEAGTALLSANESWRKLAEGDRQDILATVALIQPGNLVISSDQQLLAALEAQPISARRAETDAIPTRVQKVLDLAAKRLEPKARTVSLERATLKTKDDVRAWVKKQEGVLLKEVEQGPVIVS